LARRGYILTGDTSYLINFYNRQNNVKKAINELKALISDNINQMQEVNKLDSLSVGLLNVLNQSVEKYQIEQNVSVSQIEATDEVEKRLEEISVVLKEIGNEENKLLQQRNSELLSSSSGTRLSITITSLFTFIAIGLSLFISVRLIQNKRRTENLLKQSYEELEDKVEARTSELKAANETLTNEINNRINAENSLRESEERFRIMADSSPVMIWMSDEDKSRTYFNKVWLDFTGRSFQLELGNGWADGVHPENLQRCLDTYILAFDKRENFEVEYRLKNAYGEYVWILDKGIPRYEGNKFVGYIGGCINIHERKRNERYLKIQYAVSKTLAEASTVEETCMRVLENICNGVNWEFGILWMVNKDKNKLLPESTWGTNSFKAKEFIRVYDKYIEKGKDLPGIVWETRKSMWLMDIHYDKNFERKDIASRLGWNSAFAVPITNGYEIIAVIECFNKDILTPKADLLEVLESAGRQIGNYLERKKTENKLKESYAELEERVNERTIELANTLNKLISEIEVKEKIQNKLKLFAHAIRGIKECVYITDLNNKTLFINASFESIYGYSEDELKEKEIPVLFSDKVSRELRDEILTKTLKDGWLGELKNKRKGGSEFDVHLSTSVIRDDNGKIQAIVGICQDITEIKAAGKLIIKRNGLLKLLNDIIIVTNKSFDLKSSISYAINKVCQYTSWNLGHCYLSNGNNLLISTNIWNYDLDSKYAEFREKTEQITFKKGSGLIGKTFEEVKSSWLNIKEVDESSYKRIEVASKLGLKTIICIPIMKQTTPVGVLEFYKTEEEALDNEVLECISNIGIELGSLAERIEILEQIKVSERQFKAVADTANDAIITINQEGKIVYVNNSTEKVFGYGENELINRDLSMLIPGKYLDRYKVAFKKAFASGELILQGKTFEFSGKNRNNGEFPIELSLAKWEINSEAYITAMVKDITLRKEIEKELLEKQKMLEVAQQIAKLGTWEWDVKNNIVIWSTELYSIYEINEKDFNPSYEGFLERVHPEDIENVKQIIQKAYETKGAFSFYHKIITPLGKIKILKAMGEVYTDEDGNVVRMFGTGLDITDIREAEEKIRESERQLKEAQKIAKLGSWKYNVKENEVYWSDEMYNIFEIKRTEKLFFNETFLKYVFSEDKPILESVTKKIFEEKQSYGYEYRIRTISGKVKYLKGQGEVHLDKNNEIEYIVGTGNDITDIKQAEIKIRESEKQLKQAQKIAHLGSWELNMKTGKIIWS
ncbi:MAG TPA: PAS domain S-box protein, partial [Ignavibacteria bacterium]